jgi:hypothetical protein
MDFINTAISRGTLARFFLEKNDAGHYDITLHAHVTGAYERRAVAPAMDMWNDDLLLLRDRPATANEINGSADTAIAGRWCTRSASTTFELPLANIGRMTGPVSPH